VTGLTFQLGPLKLYQMLKEAAPAITRGVYIYDPASAPPGMPEQLRSEGQRVKVEWQTVALRDDPNDVAQAFAEIGRGPNGLVLDQASRLQLKAARICGFALQRKIASLARSRKPLPHVLRGKYERYASPRRWARRQDLEGRQAV
jgi:hypothetical protein